MEREAFLSLEQKYWSEIYIAYSASKRLFIEAEEKLSKMSFFPAPLVEHRDALDHIMQYVNIKNMQGECEEALHQLSNARQHELRCFFDVADYICVIIREEISRALSFVSKRQIKKIWNAYSETREKVLNISQQLAEVRSKRTESLDQIPVYQALIAEIFDIYGFYIKNVYPSVGYFGRIVMALRGLK